MDEGPSDQEEMTIRAVVDEKYYDETPTVKVHAAILDSTKFISKMVKLLSETSPIPSLQHLKRVKRMGGRSYVILDLVPDEEELAEEEEEERPAKRLKLDESLVLRRLKDKGFDYEASGVVSVEVCDVPQHGPKTRVQYEKAMVYWPVNFHPEKKLETMMSEKVFEDSEHRHHVRMMRFVLRRSEEMEKKNVALVVDYVAREPIAMGYERVEAHPLQHAVMVAVDAVASTYQGGAWELPFEELTFPRKREVCAEEEKKAVEVVIPEPGEEDVVPYLCTGYDLYVVREPCVMCAMSLVHSRIRRVFFHVRNPEKGALISKCQIHTIKDLNHHYDVFEMMKG